VDIASRTPGWWAIANALQINFFLATITGAFSFIVVAAIAVATPGAMPWWAWAASIGVLVLGILGSIITSVVAKSARNRGADEAAAAVDADLRSAVAHAAQSSYLQPVNAVIATHRDAYQRLA
ncbi:ABC transporter, partial [Burkholderia multivorans]